MQEEQKEYGGSWQLMQPINKSWEMHYRSLSFQVQLGSSRHIGVFPEQASHWDWITEQIKAAGRPLRVLNLFGYSGLATLAATNAGAEVTHVDSSKHALNWASYNLKLSGLAENQCDGSPRMLCASPSGKHAVGTAIMASSWTHPNLAAG